MVLEVGDLAEPAVADRAPVRPGAVVDVHVRLEVARGGEGLLAQLALVGLLLLKERKQKMSKICTY